MDNAIQDIAAELRAPFARADLSVVQIEEYPSKKNRQGNTPPERVCFSLYVDARAVMDRLDAVVGPAAWFDAYEPGPAGGVMCTLSLKIDGEWIAKADGADSGDISPEKGGYSRAFRRAAIKWGIGRYLYALGRLWVDFDDLKGKRITERNEIVLDRFIRRAPEGSAEATGSPRQAETAPSRGTRRQKPAAAAEAPAGPQAGNAFEKALASLMEQYGVSTLEVAERLRCLPEEVPREVQAWTQSTGLTVRDLFVEIKQLAAAASGS